MVLFGLPVAVPSGPYSSVPAVARASAEISAVLPVCKTSDTEMSPPSPMPPMYSRKVSAPAVESIRLRVGVQSNVRKSVFNTVVPPADTQARYIALPEKAVIFYSFTQKVLPDMSPLPYRLYCHSAGFQRERNLPLAPTRKSSSPIRSTFPCAAGR